MVAEGTEIRYECSHREEHIKRIWQQAYDNINNDNNSQYLFIYLFLQILLICTSFVPGTVLGPGYIAMHMTGKAASLMEFRC